MDFNQEEKERKQKNNESCEKRPCGRLWHKTNIFDAEASATVYHRGPEGVPVICLRQPSHFARGPLWKIIIK